MSRYPYVDRAPCIRAAGKSFGDPCANVKNILQEISLQEKVDVLRKQLGLVEPKGSGEAKIKPPKDDSLGAFTEIRHCLRPPMRTYFQRLTDEIQNTIYDSYWNKALGESRDQTPGLPAGMQPEKVTMGKPGAHDISAKELLHPKKTEEQLAADQIFYENYSPGLQTKYCYKPPFNEYTAYGKASKKDERGTRVKECMTWFNNDPICHVSRRLAAVRNRTLPAVGKGLDKTGVTDLFPEDHVYGKPYKCDFYGVEDLLNECPPSLMRRDMLTFLSYVNSLRQSVFNKINNEDFTLEELCEELLSLNKDKKDDPNSAVNFDCIDKIMKRHRIYLDRSKLEPLLAILGKLTKDGEIKVQDFITIIDKNSLFPIIKKQFYILPPEFQTCGNSCKFEEPKNDYLIQSMPPAGMPTVRMDKSYPIYRDSIVNMGNLSEETTARALISPSIYTQYGLSHRDFFQPRSKEFLGSLFRKTNVDLTDELLDEMYQEGYELDKTGGVCVETFRNILDDRAYKAYNKNK